MTSLWQLVMEWSVVQLLTAGVAACGVGGIVWRMVTCNRRQNAMLLAMGQYLLMIEGEGLLARGSMSISEWAIFHQLYEAYHALGGNGTLAELYCKCQELDIRKEQGYADEWTGSYAE